MIHKGLIISMEVVRVGTALLFVIYSNYRYYSSYTMGDLKLLALTPTCFCDIHTKTCRLQLSKMRRQRFDTSMKISHQPSLGKKKIIHQTSLFRHFVPHIMQHLIEKYTKRTKNQSYSSSSRTSFLLLTLKIARNWLLQVQKFLSSIRMDSPRLSYSKF